MVDVDSERYRVARRYMIRLNREDFEDMHQVAKLAATAGISLAQFRRDFAYLVEHEPAPIKLIHGAPSAREMAADAPLQEELPVQPASGQRRARRRLTVV